jgi:phosphoglycolate phosphatase-like HAD superfamily hydrolase
MKHIVFDFDWVISDTYELNYKLTQLERPNITREEHRNLFLGNIFEELKKMPASALSKEELMEYKNTIFYPQKRACSLYPNIYQVLKKLSQTFDLSINTSSSADEIQLYLSHNNLDHIFSDILGSEFSKSKVQKFAYIMEKYNLKKSDMIFVTDTVGDVKEASAFWILSLVVTYGYMQRHCFDDFQNTIIGFATTPAGIMELLIK